MTLRLRDTGLLLAALVVWLVLGRHDCLAADAPEPEYISETLQQRVSSASLSWGSLGWNTAVKPSHREPSRLRIGSTAYQRGLGVHAESEVAVDLAGEYLLFEAEVGLQWQGGKAVGSVVFQVFVDDRKEFDSGIMKESDPPRTVHVSVKDADELRLVVGSAGDGITSDVANWADARLIRDPEAKSRRRREAVNVAPFARVVTSDPRQIEGTKADRKHEFPAEDLTLVEELLPAADGSFLAPVTDGIGCIGLEWREFRYFRQVGLRFAGPAAVPEQVELQQWVGQSSWQGAWRTLDASVENSAGQWIWTLDHPDRQRPTDKIRWLFRDPTKPIVVAGLTAHTMSAWKTATLRIEAESKAAAQSVSIELYNGEFLEPDGGASSSFHRTWDASRPLQAALRYARTRRCKTDQTVLRFDIAGRAFGVGVEDVLANEAVYVPEAGLLVTREPAPVSLGEYVTKIAGRKTLRQQVDEMPDQTFERALEAVHLPIQNLGPMMLSLACDERKFVAYREGAVGFTLKEKPSAVFDGQTRRGGRSFPYQLHPVFGDGTYEKLSRHLEGGWLPIPVTSVDEEGVVYTARTCVAPLDDLPVAGGPDWLRRRAACVVEYTMENTRSTHAEAVLMLSVLDKKRAEPSQKMALAQVDGGVIASSDGRLLVFIDTSNAAPLDTKTDSQTAIVLGTLPPGAKAQVAAYLPAWKTSPDEYATFHGQAPQLVAKVKQYWEDLLAPAAQIELPDQLLSNVVRASQVHIMLAAGSEENGARIDAWTSADRYGALESESQPILRGMDMMGQQEFARRGLDFFVARYNEAGFLTTGYTIMGSGWHLWTLAEFVDRSQDLDWFRKVAPEVARMCRWIVAQREKTKRLDAHGRKVPNYGLTPPGVIADWARLTNTTFQEAHYSSGLREAARVLAKIGHPDAEALAKSAEEYRADILRAYRWTQARSPVVPLGNGAWVPAQPPIFFIFGDVGGFFPGEDGSRAWCKNAMAHHLMVNRIIDPHAEEVSWMLDIMEGIEFLRSGLGESAYDAETNERLWFDLGGFNKCQPYYRRSVELYALRDEVKPFIRGYFNTIPSLLSLENLSFWEHFHNQGGWNKTHETGWFLCQTRIMLLAERGDELWLAPFVTRNWLKDGMAIRVQNAPTNFGKAGYTIQSAVDRGVIEAVIDPPQASPPSQIVLRLRHPDEKPIKDVTVNGKPHGGFDAQGEIIRLKPGLQRMLVRVAYCE